MKHVAKVLGFLFLILTCACDKEEPIEFNKEALNMTIWRGEMYSYFEESNYKLYVKFYNNNYANFGYSSVEKSEPEPSATSHVFKFLINDRMIEIVGVDNSLLQDGWWVTKFTKKTLELSTSPGSKSASIIKLNRIY